MKWIPYQRHLYSHGTFNTTPVATLQCVPSWVSMRFGHSHPRWSVWPAGERPSLVLVANHCQNRAVLYFIHSVAVSIIHASLQIKLIQVGRDWFAVSAEQRFLTSSIIAERYQGSTEAEHRSATPETCAYWSNVLCAVNETNTATFCWSVERDKNNTNGTHTIRGYLRVCLSSYAIKNPYSDMVGCACRGLLCDNLMRWIAWYVNLIHITIGLLHSFTSKRGHFVRMLQKYYN